MGVGMAVGVGVDWLRHMRWLRRATSTNNTQIRLPSRRSLTTQLSRPISDLSVQISDFRGVVSDIFFSEIV
jgi:hypothetical protein